MRWRRCHDGLWCERWICCCLKICLQVLFKYSAEKFQYYFLRNSEFLFHQRGSPWLQGKNVFTKHRNICLMNLSRQTLQRCEAVVQSQSLRKVTSWTHWGRTSLWCETLVKQFRSSQIQLRTIAMSEAIWEISSMTLPCLIDTFKNA